MNLTPNLSNLLALDADSLRRFSIREANAAMARSDAWVRVWRATRSDAEADAAGQAAYVAIMEVQ